MNKIAIIESIHEEGINLLKKHPNFKYEIITDVSEENLLNYVEASCFNKTIIDKQLVRYSIIKNCSDLTSKK